MGKIVPFTSRNRLDTTDSEKSNINELLKCAVELQKRVFGETKNGIYCPQANFRELMAAKICSILLKEKIIRTDLFECSLYLAKMMEGMLDKVPQSFYAVDYFVKGFEEKNSLVLREGADYCAMVCIFFEGRRNWRAMNPKDYERLGSSLYHAYYDLSGKPIGWYMGKNFKEMIPIAKRSIESLRN
jgi:hypothetical protein